VRKIKLKTLVKVVEVLCAEANFELPADILKSLRQNYVFETGLARDILREIIENAVLAKREKIPLCQDTGTANFFVKLGRSVIIEDGNMCDGINRGVSLGYINNYLRKSIVSDPIVRKNTQDNTPANIHLDIVNGDKIEITFLAKGGGSENASMLKMLVPSVGWTGVKEFILNTVNDGGRNACPPLIIGVGIGGDFATVCFLAKKALLRKIGSKNQNTFYCDKEQELLSDINKLNIGPMGVGGKTTALAVFIETKPTHIASLSVAVNIQCHSCRRKMVVI
jgi:fumarate hydratase subunit alpha